MSSSESFCLNDGMLFPFPSLIAAAICSSERERCHREFVRSGCPFAFHAGVPAPFCPWQIEHLDPYNAAPFAVAPVVPAGTDAEFRVAETEANGDHVNPRNTFPTRIARINRVVFILVLHWA